MARFMILYRSSVDAAQQMAAGSPEQAQEGMKLWMQWAEKAGPSLVDLGSPLGNAHLVPATDSGASGLPVGGFSILEAESAEAVTKILDGHPHLMAPGGVIEILEYLPPPGM